MRLKITRPVVFFDVETTGTDTQIDKIVQLSLIKVMPDGEKEVKTRLINPEMPIPKEAYDIHGITDDMVALEPVFSQIAKSLISFFEGCDIGGYNIMRFDIPILMNELKRAGIKFDVSKYRYIDVMKIYHKLKPRTLEACYTEFTGKVIEDAHDAEADTLATIEALEGMIEVSADEIGDSIDTMDEFVENNKMVDVAGCFIKDDEGKIIFNFGKLKGKPAYDVGFLGWMQKQSFNDDTLMWAGKLLGGAMKYHRNKKS